MAGFGGLNKPESQKVSQLSGIEFEFEVSEISEIFRIVGWALETSGLTYKSFVVISINPKDHNGTFYNGTL